MRFSLNKTSYYEIMVNENRKLESVWILVAATEIISVLPDPTVINEIRIIKRKEYHE